MAYLSFVLNFLFCICFVGTNDGLNSATTLFPNQRKFSITANSAQTTLSTATTNSLTTTNPKNDTKTQPPTEIGTIHEIYQVDLYMIIGDIELCTCRFV